MPTMPLSNLIAGLREHRDELADRLEKIERARATVSADIEAIESALHALTPQHQQRPAVAEVKPQIIASTPPRELWSRRGGYGQLSAFVYDALRDGAKTSAEIVATARQANRPLVSSQVHSALQYLRQTKQIVGVAIGGGRAKRWRLRTSIPAVA